MNELTQYFVGLDDPSTAMQPRWYVSRGAPACCLGLFRRAGDALAQAMALAGYRAIEGQAAQVHLQDHTDGAWRTLWCSEGTTPRFPEPFATLDDGVALAQPA